MGVTVKDKAGNRKKVGKKSAAAEFADNLEQAKDAQTGMKTDFWVAFHLGRLPKDVMAGMHEGIIARFTELPPRYTTPLPGVEVLHPQAQVAISRGESGTTVLISYPPNEQFVTATHTDPGIAWSVALIRAVEAGMVPKRD
jgi:hypothetical protein